MDLEHVGRPEDEVEALEAGDAARVVPEDDVVAYAPVADAPHGDGVEQDGQGGVRDAGDAGHDRLGHVLALEGGGEVAGSAGI